MFRLQAQEKKGDAHMGYRSVVTLTLHEKDYKDMVIAAKQEPDEYVFDFVTKSATLYKNKDVITLHWGWVKWYDNYNDVGFVERFMRSGVEYNFKRIGEESGDVEEESNDPDWTLGEATEIITDIYMDNVGEEQDIDEYLKTIEFEPQKQQPEDDGAEIEEVSEDALLEVVCA